MFDGFVSYCRNLVPTKTYEPIWMRFFLFQLSFLDMILRWVLPRSVSTFQEHNVDRKMGLRVDLWHRKS